MPLTLYGLEFHTLTCSQGSLPLPFYIYVLMHVTQVMLVLQHDLK